MVANETSVFAAFGIADFGGGTAFAHKLTLAFRGAFENTVDAWVRGTVFSGGAVPASIVLDIAAEGTLRLR